MCWSCHLIYSCNFVAYMYVTSYNVKMHFFDTFLMFICQGPTGNECSPSIWVWSSTFTCKGQPAPITNKLRARSYVLGTQPRQNVLGTRAFILPALWNVLGTHSFKVENGMHLGLRSMTYCVYTAQRVRSFWCALSMLIAVCVLSPAHLEVRTLFSVHERSYLFWMCTKGAICSENMVWPCSSWNCSSGEQFSLEPVQTTRNGVYREHVPRTCSRWNCTENKYERPVSGETKRAKYF